jgi:very-short-patch-repair endonuclease
MCPVPLPPTVLEIAERQHGLALVDTARTAGVTREALRHAVRQGDAEQVTSRVLRLPGTPRTGHQRVLTAVLDASPGAFACGHTAASLWGIPSYPLSRVHVTRSRGMTGRRTRLAVLHEVKTLLPRHVTVLDAIPIVRPERLALELCASEQPLRAARAVDDMWRRRLLSGRSLRRFVDDVSVHGRPGLRVLRALLDERGDDYVPPASNLESRFTAVIARAGLPEMRRQVDSGGDVWVGRVDFRDTRQPLIVEIQSERYHTALTDRHADRARLAALRDAGFEVVEVTENQVWHRPDEVVRLIEDARRSCHRNLPRNGWPGPPIPRQVPG